jgi:uncharacterized membrane protein
MSKRIVIIASVVGVVFVFAGYNHYYYLQAQAVVAEQNEQAAEQRRVELEAKRSAEEARKAQEKRLAEEREAAARAAEAERQERQRLAAEAQRQAEQAAAEKVQAARDAERLAKLIERAREVRSIEGFDEDALSRLRAMSPRFLLDNPAAATEVMSIPPNTEVLSGPRRLLKDRSTSFMLLAAATHNTKALQAALDAGANINAVNVDGYTALMFAAAYSSADIVRFLIASGADISAGATKFNLNALHIACLFNPHPDVVEALIKGGLDIEGKTSTGDAPLVLAALDNPNLEVIQRLVELGADKSAYSSQDGRTVHGIVSERLGKRGYRKLTDEMDALILNYLK